MPSARRGSTELEQPDGNIPGANAPVMATQWKLLSSRWFNLPAALLIGLIALVTVVPPPSVDLPAISMPWTDSNDDDPANLAALDPSPIAIGTPVRSATPAGQLAAGPVDPQAVADTAGGITSDLVTTATVRPNELGGVPIIMYHAFTTNPKYLDEWTLTLDQFREQLDWYREHDFVMVGVQSMIDGHFDVPAGKTPIILTFDDASMGQFGLQKADDGGWEVRPDTAVGILEEYKQKYPEFVGPAFFAVLSWNCFASDDDPSTCEERLNWLVEHDYEVGNHTWDHVDMTDVSDEFFTNSIIAMMDWINERVPEGPGNLSNVVVMPFGAYPDPDLHPEQRGWLKWGMWQNGEEYFLPVVMAVEGGPAIPPYRMDADPSYTYRIASYPDILEPWMDRIVSGEVSVFISDGDPGAVTIPADRIADLDEVWCAEKGLEVRTYDADGA
jgi:peptidoglycan/xylan/chitin deacetylase (PgdA/CDA1 family)